MKIISKLLLILIFCIGITVNADVGIDEEGNYTVDVDKYIPSKGVKVKNSRLADMMENGTRKAMNKNKQTDEITSSRSNKTSGEYSKYKESKRNKQYVTIGGYRLF